MLTGLWKSSSIANSVTMRLICRIENGTNNDFSYWNEVSL